MTIVKRLKCFVPKRYIVVILAFFGYMNLFSMRINLSVAIVAMVNRNQTKEDEVLNNTFNWDSNERGIILAAFYYGYILTQLPGGFAATKIGGHIVFGYGILINSIACVLTPVVTNYGNIIGIVIIRVVQGLAQGLAYPSCHALFANWAPHDEKSRMVSITLSGIPFGTVLTNMLSGVLAVNYGWPSIFYVFGALGIIWFIVWIIVVRGSPENDRWMSDEEKRYIKEHTTENSEKLITPWKKIFLSVPVWAVTIVITCYDWGFYTLLSYLPDYLKNTLKFELATTGFIFALPFITMVIGTQVAGFCADFLKIKGYLSVTRIRKYFIIVSSIMQAVSLAILSYTSDPILCVMYLILSVAAGSFTISASLVNPLDIAPKYAGIILGISNTFATLPGILSPILTGFIVLESTIEEWRIIFLLSAGIYIVGAALYGILGSGEVQPWAKTADESNGEREHGI